MKVSVVIPTFNRAHLISIALDSILRQDYHDLEIIVVDDGSTNGSAKILQMQYKDSIKYVYQENLGFGAARNRGVAEATGEYIAFLDSDDVWNDNKISLQVAIMNDHPDISFLFSDFSIVKEDGKVIHAGLDTWFAKPVNWSAILPHHVEYAHCPSSGSPQQYSLYFGNLYHSLLTAPYVLPSTAMVRKTALESGVVHTEGDPFCADWNFFALLSQNNGQACYLQHETAQNRSHYDAVRSTQTTSLSEKLHYRLQSINEIWKSDQLFMNDYCQDVEMAESDILLKLAKQAYRMHRPNETIEYLEKWRNKKIRQGKTIALLLSMLVRIPGSSKLLTLIR